VLASRGGPLFAVALQNALRAPRPGMALRLSAALSGVGIGGGASEGGGGSGAAGGAAATIRALGATPPPPAPQATVVHDGASVLPPHSARLVLNMLQQVRARLLT
jgi:hypothetical protein